MLPLTLNSLICKSNMRSLNVIMIVSNNLNKLSNQVKLMYSYTSYTFSSNAFRFIYVGAIFFILICCIEQYCCIVVCICLFVVLLYCIVLSCITIVSFKKGLINLCNKYTYCSMIVPTGIVLLYALCFNSIICVDDLYITVHNCNSFFR